ncbi:stage II sporulation protein M [Sinanaerobacter sp. ZZT-01]|uniref:stage II sporulation protein M n=1 Tax=Sinanaerobacter sp. ZZT-01 TaxID=3111540 RepID=UPI002D787701|nr:stage II sporulation protein M [Sinanaerobacter sp. ZZT-01]WRR92511.1 stage II sporulation protein M [Sinanaerobacter sp. ZZT-01]
MKKNMYSKLIPLAIERNTTIFSVLFFFLVGISIGTFMELMLSAQDKNELSQYLNANLFAENITSLPQIFINSLGNNLGLLILIALSGITVIGFPVALLSVAYKGVTLGFSSALLLETLSLKGIVLILLTIVPQNIILIPTFLLAAACAINFAGNAISARKTGIKKNLTNNVGSYLVYYILFSIVLLAGCLIESFICPILLQLIG